MGRSNTESYNYDKQTKNKVATFYNPAIKEYYDGVKNELSAVSKMENYVAEVAISFDQPYTLKRNSNKNTRQLKYRMAIYGLTY